MSYSTHYLLTIAAQRQAELVAAAEQYRLARHVKRAGTRLSRTTHTTGR